VDGSGLAEFCIDSLDDYTTTYEPDGTPAEFRADITYSAGPDGAPTQYPLKVNSPLRAEGLRVYLVSHGFAPRFTIRTPDGTEVRDVSAPFLPLDGALLSEGAVKLLDTVDPQLALFGLFAPTAAQSADGTIRSLDSRPTLPAVAVQVYRGDLGLDSGAPQSVYAIDQRQVTNGALKVVANVTLTQLSPTVRLDDGTTITYEGYREWATLQVNHDPGQAVVLWAAGAIVLGLLLSLSVRRRRLFLRITRASTPTGGSVDNSTPVDDGSPPAPDRRTVVAVGGLARTDAGSYDTEFARVVERLRDTSDLRKD
jgi:cytochrome c biogenesis protein